MPDTDRASAFIAAIRAASHAYGFELRAVLQSEQLGDAVLTKPTLELRPLANWTPPPGSQEDTATHGNVGQ